MTLQPGQSDVLGYQGTEVSNWSIGLGGFSENPTIVDGGSFADCATGEVPDDYTWTTVCGDEVGEMTFTNAASSPGSINVILTAGVGYFLAPGESLTSHPEGPYPPAGSRYEQWFINVEGQQSDSGDFSECTGTTPPTTQPGGGEVPDEAPELISECRGADWYLVHPDDSPATTYAYRMSTGDILYDGDYTSNNPAAVYGEVLIPAGVNEVGYADDFNVQHTVTRPAECGGPETPTTTAPPTTAAPTTPGEPIPNTPGLGAITTDGFVVPGAEIGPGMATFGATGFAPGEAVEVTLFSTPRALGTVTADANGNASITFEVLASDGAGEHRVQFSGPSGTFSVPFTLVLPEAAQQPEQQSLPVTR
jgi:hypothetical protein